MDEHKPAGAAPSTPPTTASPPETAIPPVPDMPPEDGSPDDPAAASPIGDVATIPPAETATEPLDEVDGDWVEVEEIVTPEDGVGAAAGQVVRVRRRRRVPKADAAEMRLRGRRALCKSIADIAPHMLKMVKLRVLNKFPQASRRQEDDELTEAIRKAVDKFADRTRVIAAVTAHDPDFNRGQLKAIIFEILLQEETHSLDEHRLDEKVTEFEKDLVKRSKTLDFFDPKKHDPDRWHHYDTYRIVLEAAWKHDDTISPDEARLLAVMRDHLSISMEEHWLISALLKRFPKEKCALHTPDEINDARKELQREGILWSYRDENNCNIDVIPAEIVAVIRRDIAGQELQRANYRRLVHHDSILLADLRNILHARNLDRYGNKAELIDRVVASNIKPSEVLNDLDRQKLSEMCGSVGLRTSGTKAELIERLIDFYDDLTFGVRPDPRDDREVWYDNYELLAARAYAELRAKKLITKDLEIEHRFEDATVFLFETRLRVPCDRSRKDHRADGRLPLENEQSILWDCKSVEGAVNLQDHLEGQFDGYLRKERENGRQPLAFLVVGPAFTPQSLKLAYQYKARTNWDVAMVTAEGLKHLAERWAATEPTKPFPIRLLNRTEIIDKERAEYLLSLA